MAAEICVLAPAPLLTVTIEATEGGGEVHLHPGGQGFWIARLMAALGCEVAICASFGGEAGPVVRTLMTEQGLEVRAVAASTGNAAYVHDRRRGRREPLLEMAPSPLTRHEVDELYDLTLVTALDARACVLGGPSGARVLPADVYRRLASDLRGRDRVVVADLSGEELEAVLAGGVSVLKVSHESLLADGRARGDSVEELASACRELQAAGAERVVVSRSGEPALALGDGELVEVVSPGFEPVEPRGAGDSMTAGLAVSMARGAGWEEALRRGAAAGALNVTRRGLGSGNPELIERLSREVELRRLGPA